MSKKCAICGKKPMVGANVSHSHNVTKKRFMPNLQKIRVEIDGKPQKTYVCTKCLKSGFAKKAI